MTDNEIPFVGFEKGYFLDIQSFFPEKELDGLKVLSGQCNLRCYYCHRRDFLDISQPLVSPDSILAELDKKAPFNTVVLTGGEITLCHSAAIKLLRELRGRGVTTLFSTNGSMPERVAEMARFADIVKVDIKSDRSNYQKVAGQQIYDSAMKSVALASRLTKVEAKLLLHSFSRPHHVNEVLEDIAHQTGMASNLGVEFQPIRDFLRRGLPEPNIADVMAFCASAHPLPEITLLKHYGERERIYRLEAGTWQLFREKEIPLRFNWKDASAR